MLLLIFPFDSCYLSGTVCSNYREFCGSFEELGTLLGIEPQKVQFSFVESCVLPFHHAITPPFSSDDLDCFSFLCVSQQYITFHVSLNGFNVRLAG